MSMNYEGTPGDYSYTQSANGKSASGVVAVGAQSERNPGAQRSAGGQDRQPGDHGGHLIAHSLGGRNDSTNLDPQAANVNQKDQANVERNVANLASNPNNTVAMNVSNFNSVGDRPDATMINVGVKDNTTGNISEEHLSFQNASHDLQESWNNTSIQADPDIDPTQNVGMNDEQRELADNLSGAEDVVDDKIGPDGIYMEFDSSFLDGGEVEPDANGAGIIGDDTADASSVDSSDDVSSDESSDDGGLGE